MPKWINRTELAGSSVNPNGTNSHTCTFAPASAGNYLLAIVAGAMTSTTPAGWSLLSYAVNYAGVYMFGKVATGGEGSFNTTHNASDFSIAGVVYELPAGTVWLNSGFQPSVAGSGPHSEPSIAGLTGTYSVFTARSHNLDVSSFSGSINATWLMPSTEDYEVSVAARPGIDGIGLSVAYQDNLIDSTFNPSYSITVTNSSNNVGECIATALYIPDVASAITNTLKLGAITPTKLYVGNTEVSRAYLGSTIVYDNPEVEQPVGEPVPRLYMTPAAGSYNSGDTVQVTIRADSLSEAVNVVQANFTYPTSQLTFQSISTATGAFPSTIQSVGGGGEVKIGAGILAGDTRGDQIVAVVTFTVSGTGSANLNFVFGDSAIVRRSGAVNILEQTTGAIFTIS